jgi:surface antigen
MDYGPTYPPPEGYDSQYYPPEGYGSQQYYPPAMGPEGLPTDNSRGFYTWQLGIEGGTCNRPELQRFAANLTGAQPASLAVGTQLGGIPVQRVIGGKIGPRLDVTDQACATQALEHAQTGSRVRWETASGIPITFKVTNTKDNPGEQRCRDFEATAQFASQVQTVHNTACKGQDGAWRTTR